MTILEGLQNYINDDNNKYYGYEISSHNAKEIVKALQFQQSVVRCKDCNYRWPNTRCNYWSNADSWFGRFVEDDDFCSNGEWRNKNE